MWFVIAGSSRVGSPTSMRCHHYLGAFSRQIVCQDMFSGLSLPAQSCRWLSVQIPFKRNHRFLNFVPIFWPTGWRWMKPNGGAFRFQQISTILKASFILTWVQADAAPLACPAHHGSLEKHVQNFCRRRARFVLHDIASEYDTTKIFFGTFGSNSMLTKWQTL